MKKFFILVLCFFMLAIPVSEATMSPDLRDLYYFEPSVKFDFLSQNFTNINLEEIDPLSLLKGYDELLDTTKYHIDDTFIIYLEEQIPELYVRTLTTYEKEDWVFSIIIDENEQVYILPCFIELDGGFTIDFSSIPVNNLFVYIISNCVEQNYE